MAKCFICGKGAQTGYNVSHSKRHTKRRWLPNLHPYTMPINGELKSVLICTRCRRTQHKLTV